MNQFLIHQKKYHNFLIQQNKQLYNRIHYQCKVNNQIRIKHIRANPMSTANNKPNNQQNLLEQNDSSSLSYLNQPNDQQADKSSPNQNSKKRPGPQIDRDSQVRRVYVNNRLKQKKSQNDAIFEGIFLYKPGVQLPNLYHFANQSIKIIIASQYIRKQNPQILKRNIYGTDPYTSNSDAVCMLVHSGMININTFQNKKYEGVELTCKVIKPKKNYSGITKNNLTSRSLKGYNGNALKPQSVKNLTSLGAIQVLEKYASNMHIPIGKSRIRPKPKNIANIIPIPETHIVFNMNNQPAYKYSIFNIADKGFDKNEFIIKKLDNMVLYLETQTGDKYELSKRLEMNVFDAFRLAKIKHPQQVDNEFLTGHSCPLKEDQIEVLYPSLDWSEILWGNTSIFVKKEKRIQGLKSFKFYKKDKDQK